MLERAELEHRQVEALAVEGHERGAVEPLPGALEEARLVAAAVGPGGDVHDPHDPAVLYRLEQTAGDGPVVGEREEVAPAAGARAPVREHPAELLRIGARGLAVDRADERLVGDRLEIERHEPSHETQCRKPV